MVMHRKQRSALPGPAADAEEWARSLAPQLGPEARGLFESACALFVRARDQGEDEEAVAETSALTATELLADLGFDAESLAAALLLREVSSGHVEIEVVRDGLGTTVAELIDGAQRMEVIEGLREARAVQDIDDAQREALRRMLFSMASDVRVVIITLAWRVAELRAVKLMAAEVQRAAARKALEIYAPLANRLGIWQIKWELEDLALRYLEPERYKDLARRLEERRVDRETYLERFVSDLQNNLRAAGIVAEVKGRPKHIYSIWNKMRRKNLGFDEIFDIRAVRVIVSSVAECYAVLGVVHSRWHYIRSEFDDYIAAPKENNYQSLHTAVVGPGDKIVEVQIRTRDMDQYAELGVAAHWRYKEGAAADLSLERKLTWLRQLLDWRDNVVDSGARTESGTARPAERIYVFTPKGKIIDLPEGGTPIDFAYHIHSDVGHRCRGAKVGGKIVPLTTPLNNGDVVEVLTVKQGGPSRDWLNANLGFVKSSKAREKIASWFKQEFFDDHVDAGRASVERELARLHIVDVNFERLAQRLEFGKPENLFAAIGRGDMKVSQVVHALQSARPVAEPAPRAAPQARPSRRKTSVIIEGEGNVMSSFGKCCKPVPGDEIVGYITRGRGVTLHRPGCSSLARYRVSEPERLVHAEWGSARDAEYPVDVQIVANDRQGLLRDITSVLANEKINVTATNSISNAQTNQASITLTLQVKDTEQFGRVLGQIARLPSVISARRP
jgi:GTP pyrophosphokinase